MDPRSECETGVTPSEATRTVGMTTNLTSIRRYMDEAFERLLTFYLVTGV